MYSHIRRSDCLPKKSAPSKERALKTARFMSNKYGSQYSVYKCIYCDGWHLAKDSEKSENFKHREKLTSSFNATTRHNAQEVDVNQLLKLDIPDIAEVYGGIRGRTMSSRHQDYAWPIIRDCGIDTIIDLREDGIYTRLNKLCEKFGLEYFYFPIDTKAENIKCLIDDFENFCKKIDRGHFYIACAMGLHRTDIALCTYWVFYGADKGIIPPKIRGYNQTNGHKMDKVMRFLNAFYNELSLSVPSTISFATFNQRKQVLIECSKADPGK